MKLNDLRSAHTTWVATEAKIAVSKKLPRSWVPQQAVDGRQLYLHLKTGKLHVLHPNLAGMQARVEDKVRRLESQVAEVLQASSLAARQV